MDQRRLITFEKILGKYSVAGALVSNADIVDFVEDEKKQGILMVDTCGHQFEDGKQMKIFVRKMIKSGWGVDGNAEEELEKFGEELIKLGKKQSEVITERFYDTVSASYTQFHGENLTHYMAGGIGNIIVLKENRFDKFFMRNEVINKPKHNRPEPVYKTRLSKDDLILIHTDGFTTNSYKYYQNKNGGDFYKEIKPTIDEIIANILMENRVKNYVEIRNIFLDEMTKYFTPKSLKDDDATFIVIKHI